MPYKSAKQSRFMHAKRPKIAARWDREAKAKKGAKKTKKRGGRKGY